jgi:pSer/pThr/pTyr-binding forkhead associated (FHA) protein
MSEAEPEARGVPEMAALFIVSGRSRGLYWPLRRSSVVAGRSETCDIQVVDHAVSRRHFEVLVDPARGGFLVRDLHSTNGLRLNGEPVADDHHLRHGDVIEIGESRLLFITEEVLDRDALLDAFKHRGERRRDTVVYRFDRRPRDGRTSAAIRAAC